MATIFFKSLPYYHTKQVGRWESERSEPRIPFVWLCCGTNTRDLGWGLSVVKVLRHGSHRTLGAYTHKSFHLAAASLTKRPAGRLIRLLYCTPLRPWVFLHYISSRDADSTHRIRLSLSLNRVVTIRILMSLTETFSFLWLLFYFSGSNQCFY